MRALGSALGSIGMLTLLPRQRLAIAMTMNVNVAAGVEAAPTPDPLQIAQVFLTVPFKTPDALAGPQDVPDREVQRTGS